MSQNMTKWKKSMQGRIKLRERKSYRSHMKDLQKVHSAVMHRYLDKQRSQQMLPKEHPIVLSLCGSVTDKLFLLKVWCP